MQYSPDESNAGCTTVSISNDETDMVKKGPATIEEYIEAAVPEARPHLRQMYRILQRVAPDGSEAIKWGVPVFWAGWAAGGSSMQVGNAHLTNRSTIRQLKRCIASANWRLDGFA